MLLIDATQYAIISSSMLTLVINIPLKCTSMNTLSVLYLYFVLSDCLHIRLTAVITRWIIHVRVGWLYRWKVRRVTYHRNRSTRRVEYATVVDTSFASFSCCSVLFAAGVQVRFLRWSFAFRSAVWEPYLNPGFAYVQSFSKFFSRQDVRVLCFFKGFF